MISEPALANSLSEGYANCCTPDQDGVTDSQGKGIPGEQRRKMQVQSMTVGLDTPNVCANGKEEDRYPK